MQCIGLMATSCKHYVSNEGLRIGLHDCNGTLSLLQTSVSVAAHIKWRDCNMHIASRHTACHCCINLQTAWAAYKFSALAPVTRPTSYCNACTSSRGQHGLCNERYLLEKLCHHQVLISSSTNGC